MSIITGLVGLFLLFLGFIIRKFNLVTIIAGYDPNKVTDKQGLARWVGNHVMLMGVLGILAGVLGFSLLNSDIYIAIAYYCLFIPFLAVKAAVGCRRFEK